MIPSWLLSKKARLIKKAKSLGFSDHEIVVSLDDFFNGNNDFGSIGVNIEPNQPSPPEFYRKFKEIKNLESVEEILVRISDIEENEWPFTDTIYIISSLDKTELKELLNDLSPDEINEGWMYHKPNNAPMIKADMKVYSVWWD